MSWYIIIMMSSNLFFGLPSDCFPIHFIHMDGRNRATGNKSIHAYNVPELLICVKWVKSWGEGGWNYGSKIITRWGIVIATVVLIIYGGQMVVQTTHADTSQTNYHGINLCFRISVFICSKIVISAGVPLLI